jgi:ribonucleoside-diphosphate reductase alpha chain
MLTMLFETGHPWITFKDACNVRSPQQHVGVVHSSNLCTEITLNTGDTEIAVCNLGSVNLAQHVVNGALDQVKLKKTVATAMRMLDNVIDINYYAVKKARDSNLRHRPVGLGIMGFQDALYEIGVPYASPEAVDFADRSMEAVCYHAYWASTELAASAAATRATAARSGTRASCRSTPSTCSRSSAARSPTATPWSTSTARRRSTGTPSGADRRARHAQLELRGDRADRDDLQHRRRQRLDRAVVRQPVGEVEPLRRVHDRQRVPGARPEEGGPVGRGDGHGPEALRRLAAAHRPRAADLKSLYATAFEIETQWLVEAAARRQKWIDQAQSLNIYMAGASGKKLDETYKLAWLRGLKTTYYLRTQSATNAEKSTVKSGTLNAVSNGARSTTSSSAAPPVVASVSSLASDTTLESDVKFCALDNPECEACQ